MERDIGKVVTRKFLTFLQVSNTITEFNTMYRISTLTKYICRCGSVHLTPPV